MFSYVLQSQNETPLYVHHSKRVCFSTMVLQNADILGFFFSQSCFSSGHILNGNHFDFQ